MKNAKQPLENTLLIPSCIKGTDLHVVPDVQMNKAYPKEHYWQINYKLFPLVDKIEGDLSYAESLIPAVVSFYNNDLWEDQLFLHMVLTQIANVEKYTNNQSVGKLLGLTRDMQSYFLFGRLINIQLVIKDIMDEHFTFVPRMSAPGIKGRLNKFLKEHTYE